MITGEGSGRRWTEKCPPMTTKRFGSTALCTRTALIVAGGMNDHYNSLQKVEVMNTETLQWSTAADLPQPLQCAIGTYFEDPVTREILQVYVHMSSKYPHPVPQVKTHS